MKTNILVHTSFMPAHTPLEARWWTGGLYGHEIWSKVHRGTYQYVLWYTLIKFHTGTYHMYLNRLSVQQGTSWYWYIPGQDFPLKYILLYASMRSFQLSSKVHTGTWEYTTCWPDLFLAAAEPCWLAWKLPNRSGRKAHFFKQKPFY